MNKTTASSPLALPSEEAASISLSSLIQLKQLASGLTLRHARARALRGGNYLSGFKGRGMEFHETRPYAPGDDARDIDWRVTARMGKAHTKLFREERERPVFLSVDARSAMFFATRGAFKYVQATRLAALLAWSAHAHGDRVGGQVFDTQGGLELKPEHGHRAVLRFLQQLAETRIKTEEAPSTGLDAALARLVRHARPGSLVFLFSDFRGLSAAGEFNLIRLRRHCEVSLVFLSDPIERRLPERGRYRFALGGRELTLEASLEAAALVEQRFIERHQKMLGLCRQHRMRFMPCSTTDNPLSALQAYPHLRPEPR
jgi:uncharacterized protein (DUF58 family)